MADSRVVSDKTPPDYIEILYWRIGERPGRLALMNILALPVAGVFGGIFLLFVFGLWGLPRFELSDQALGVFLVGLPFVIAVHEVAHGIVMQCLGAKPRYGFYGRGGLFYAKAPGYSFKRNQYLLVLLTPLVGLTVLAGIITASLMPMPTVWVVGLWATVNASAATADLWLTAVALRYPDLAYVVDESDGIRILLPKSTL